MHAASSSATAAGIISRPTRSESVTLPNVFRRSANETCLRDVASGGEAQTVAEAHHEQRRLGVELTFRPSSGTSKMREPRVELLLARPQSLIEVLDRAVGSVDEDEVEASRHDLLDRFVGQQQLDRTKADGQREDTINNGLLHLGRQPRTTAAQPLGVMALQLRAQHLVRECLLAGACERWFTQRARVPWHPPRGRPAPPASPP